MTDETMAALLGAVVGGLVGAGASAATAWWLQYRERQQRIRSIHDALLGELELAHTHLTQRSSDCKRWLEATQAHGMPYLLPTSRTATVIYDSYIAELSPELDAESRRGLHQMYEHIRVVNATLDDLKCPPETIVTLENFMRRVNYVGSEARLALAKIDLVLRKNGRSPPSVPVTPPLT